jgi:hypothetical protein
VLPCLWSVADKPVAVRYYDVNAAAVAGTTKEDMVVFASAVTDGAKIPGPCPAPLERPTAFEIRARIFDYN